MFKGTLKNKNETAAFQLACEEVRLLPEQPSLACVFQAENNERNPVWISHPLPHDSLYTF